MEIYNHFEYGKTLAIRLKQAHTRKSPDSSPLSDLRTYIILMRNYHPYPA